MFKQPLKKLCVKRLHWPNIRVWVMWIAVVLIESDMALVKIAEQIGYQSEAAFSESFKKQYGLRPGEFRRFYSGAAAWHVGRERV